MSEEEVVAALSAGLSLAEVAYSKGNNLVAVGEMGIGNSTAASVMTAALTGMPAALVTGKGTGLNAEAYANKCRVVGAVLKRHFPQPTGPRKILRCAGGLEIAAMTGMILGAARRQIAIVMDGFISTAAAAVACGLAPAVRPYLFAGHQSQEPGHRILLAHLEIEPIVELGHAPGRRYRRGPGHAHTGSGHAPLSGNGDLHFRRDQRSHCMSLRAPRFAVDIAVAFQFLTRLPVPPVSVCTRRLGACSQVLPPGWPGDRIRRGADREGTSAHLGRPSRRARRAAVPGADHRVFARRWSCRSCR